MPQSSPLQFEIPDMEGDSAVSAVEAAIHKVDAKAHVAADPATKRVVIGSSCDAEDFAQAIQDAGFKVQAAA